MAKYKLTRDLSQEEFSWLDDGWKKGRVVHAYSGCTYGCISDSGIAVTDREGETPFYEVPRDSVALVTDKEGQHQ